MPHRNQWKYGEKVVKSVRDLQNVSIINSVPYLKFTLTAMMRVVALSLVVCAVAVSIRIRPL